LRARWQLINCIMFGVATSDDQPIAWMGKYPVRLAAFLAASYLLGIIATVILQTANVNIAPLAFHVPTFLRGAFWQPLTCTFLEEVTFFSFFNILFLYWSASEVEKYLGRRRLFQLVLLLLLIPPLVISVWSIFGTHWVYFGPYEVSIGLFIAFATIYPNLEWFGWIPLKWLAFAGIVLGSMQQLPRHEWGHLSVLWVICAASFGFIRLLQRGVSVFELIGNVRLFRPKPKFQVVPRSAPRRVVEPENIHESIDPVLDKISKQGINSLTASERRALDRARNRLLKKPQ
jgi:hypothetical protein